MANIKTFEDACKALNIKSIIPGVEGLPEKHQKAITAHYQLVIIAEALNEGWQPNWNNFEERKYFPWFDVEASDEQPSGSGLSCRDYDGTSSGAVVCSRLCFKSSELAKYAGKQFVGLYQDYMLISNPALHEKV